MVVNCPVDGVVAPIGPGDDRFGVALAMAVDILDALQRSSTPVPESLIRPSMTLVQADAPAPVAWIIWLSAVGPAVGSQDGAADGEPQVPSFRM